MFFFKVTLEYHYHVNHVKYVNRTTNKSTNAERKKTSMKKIIKIAMFSVTFAAMALSATANASLLDSGSYNGTYSGPTPSYIWNPLYNFTFDSGKVYGISATMSLSAMTYTADGLGGNNTFLSIGNKNTGGEFANQAGTVGIGQNLFTWGGNVFLIGQPVRGTGTYSGPNNREIGIAPQTSNVGFSLDTRGSTWSVNYYEGGTGFNDTAVYQGGSLLSTSTGIAADTFKGIFLYYSPGSATGAQAQSVVSNFRVVDSIPEPSTYTLVIGGIATLLLFRRRVRA